MPRHAELPGPKPRVAVVVSRYHSEVTEKLLAGAVGAAEGRVVGGGSARGVRVVRVAGAFELPQMCMALASTGEFAGIVAIGCIVKGQTSHDRILSETVTNALMQIVLDTGMPLGLGLLTVDTLEQAHNRAGGSDGNKGADAMNAVLESYALTVSLFDEFGDEHSSVDPTPDGPGAAQQHSHRQRKPH